MADELGRDDVFFFSAERLFGASTRAAIAATTLQATNRFIERDLLIGHAMRARIIRCTNVIFKTAKAPRSPSRNSNQWVVLATLRFKSLPVTCPNRDESGAPGHA